MCSAPIVRSVIRVGTGVMTSGTSELVRAIPGPLGKVATAIAPENLVTNRSAGYADPVSQAIDKKTGNAPPQAPELPPPDAGDTGEAPPTPGAPAPGATSIESLQARRRKRLTALQGGLASTIATSAAGVGTPSLSTPSAGGLKLKLGA